MDEARAWTSCAEVVEREHCCVTFSARSAACVASACVRFAVFVVSEPVDDVIAAHNEWVFRDAPIADAQCLDEPQRERADRGAFARSNRAALSLEEEMGDACHAGVTTASDLLPDCDLFIFSDQNG
jgi:hypothetical protein